MTGALNGVVCLRMWFYNLGVSHLMALGLWLAQGLKRDEPVLKVHTNFHHQILKIALLESAFMVDVPVFVVAPENVV